MSRRTMVARHMPHRELAPSVVDGYPPSALCVECGGQCCKKLPGCAHPEDFNNADEGAIRTALKSGKWVIDWCGEDDLYFLRPATVHGEAIFDPSFGGTCVLLTPKGCSLDFDQRPRGCRMLEPRPLEIGCTTDYGKPEAIRDWAPYYDMLDRVGHEVLEVREGVLL